MEEPKGIYIHVSKREGGFRKENDTLKLILGVHRVLKLDAWLWMEISFSVML